MLVLLLLLYLSYYHRCCCCLYNYYYYILLLLLPLLLLPLLPLLPLLLFLLHLLLKLLCPQPQHALPDVFVWLVGNRRRLAYRRLPARRLIYSVVEEERGRDCGKVLTLFLRVSVHRRHCHCLCCCYSDHPYCRRHFHSTPCWRTRGEETAARSSLAFFVSLHHRYCLCCC